MRKSPLMCATLALSISISAACSASRSTHHRSARASSPSGSMEISRTELNSLREHVTSAYDLIKRLRPAMLRSRDPGISSSDRMQQLSPQAPGMSLYIDGMHVGGLEVLATIPAQSVTAIKRISPATASAQFGAGLTAGAIVVTTEAPASRTRPGSGRGH
jgi:hypothetical protein